jgi:hypothetical protein
MRNQLPAVVLATLPCKSHIFRKKVKKSNYKGGDVKGFLKRGDETFKNAGSEKWGMICSKMT